jgi:hypothetical protein
VELIFSEFGFLNLDNILRLCANRDLISKFTKCVKYVLSELNLAHIFPLKKFLNIIPIHARLYVPSSVFVYLVFCVRPTHLFLLGLSPMLYMIRNNSKAIVFHLSNTFFA